MYFQSDIKKSDYTVESLLNGYSEVLKNLSKYSIEQQEDALIKELEDARESLANACATIKRIYEIAELTQKYPPLECVPYINLCECLEYVIQDQNKHMEQMEEIHDLMDEIKGTVKQIRDNFNSVKPFEVKDI